METKFCPECGSELIKKELKGEGVIPYCPKCEEYRFPSFNVAVSMIVINHENGKVLLIQQYGRKKNILVAGYINRGEKAEDAVKREIREETGMTATEIRFNRTSFYEPSNTLMMNFTAFVVNDRKMKPNDEIDSFGWYTPEEALEKIAPGSLAAEFLKLYLSSR